MDTYIVYFDETGDDGRTTASSDVFVLSSIYMNSEVWQANYDTFKQFRKGLKSVYGFHTTQEMHTMHFLRDKGLYRPYGWTTEQRREIIVGFADAIASLDISSISVVIDKNNIRTQEYSVLETALTYNIQRIENDSNGQWKYLIISDKGRIVPMRRIARKIRSMNYVQSHFGSAVNRPIGSMVEDIMEKDSKESYFIQICDFVSCFVGLYYKYVQKQNALPRRIAQVLDVNTIRNVMDAFKEGGILNEKAGPYEYGLVVYPRA